MKKIPMLFAAVLLVLLAVSCKSEKKITYYDNIYSEQPVLVLITPVEDLSTRKIEKYPKDIAYNNELNTAAKYMFQTMAAPLVNRGYYCMAPLTCLQIAQQENLDSPMLHNGDLRKLSAQYGIDAVLSTTLYRWQEKNGLWIAYLEYQIRSAKTNTLLMHKYVKAVKQVPTNLKGDPVILKQDKVFAEEMSFDNGTAQRCYLLEKVNDYVLRNLPISSTRRQYKNDQYKRATPTYVQYTWNEEGKADVQDCAVEEYEQGAFL